jgi:hypothetical protein
MNKGSIAAGAAAAAAIVLTAGTAPAIAAETVIRIPRADCARLVEHRPGPGVEYKPGTDVRGKKVGPADLPGSSAGIKAPKQVEIEISFNPLRGGVGSRFGSSELIVGRVQFNLETGEATFNGQPLTDPEQTELARKCQRIVRGQKRR